MAAAVALVVQFVCAVCAAFLASAKVQASLPFRVYEPCKAGGVTGMCRTEPGFQQRAKQGAAQSTAVPQLLPVDMRFPCTEKKRCAQRGMLHVDTFTASGGECSPYIACIVIDRQHASHCGAEHRSSACPQFMMEDVAMLPCPWHLTSYTYLNVHLRALSIDVVPQPQPPLGRRVSSCNITLMPWSPFPCSYDTTEYCGIPGQPTSYCYTDNTHAASGVGPTDVAVNLTTNGYNNMFHGVLPDRLCSGADHPDVLKLLLTVSFRVATGRQFDRTYTFQFGRAVSAFGTCSEPSRLIDVDKTWSAVVDVTHLAKYMEAGMPTRFSLSNLLSNTFNVPIWATAKLGVYYVTPIPTYSQHVRTSTILADTHRNANGQQQQVKRSLLSSNVGIPNRAALCAPSTPHIPDEVVPLVLPGLIGLEALATVGGTGDNQTHWPNVTFPLSPAVSEAGDIYRAQLLVTPKANGCEEFWAMNPSGSATNTTCGGLSTGEPYREVRVYLDGQLVGFYPILYTMYTGGVDPRLWTAIVAANAYLLPTYIFDLSPWLGVINTIELRLHAITVEVLGATGSDWLLATSLLLWRSVGDVIIASSPSVYVSPSMNKLASSDCEGSLDVNGVCLLEMNNRSMAASAILEARGFIHVALVRHFMHHYHNRIEYNNMEETSSWKQHCSHDASWFMARIANVQHNNMIIGSSTSGLHVNQTDWFKSHDILHIVSQHCGAHEWLNVGGVAVGAVFELSNNVTQRCASVTAGLRWQGGASSNFKYVDASIDKIYFDQQHYQHLVMPDVYDPSNPACVIPRHATHTTMLDSHSLECHNKEVRTIWSASCAFCSPYVLTNNATKVANVVASV